ncbi:TetR/AcrR family transcriptional regulator [Microbacterium sp. A588]
MALHKRPRIGRPRIKATDEASELSPKEQILDAAAALFAEHGYVATSTRAIAERVGVRQPSLYYHFSGKDDLLAALLESTVRPSTEFALSQEQTPQWRSDPAFALYALMRFDVETLARAPHNVGALYALPEVSHDRFDAFREAHEALRRTYSEIARRAASEEVRRTSDRDLLGSMLVHLAETVITLRREGHRKIDAELFASTALRMVGLGDVEVDRCRALHRN